MTRNRPSSHRSILDDNACYIRDEYIAASRAGNKDLVVVKLDAPDRHARSIAEAAVGLTDLEHVVAKARRFGAAPYLILVMSRERAGIAFAEHQPSIAAMLADAPTSGYWSVIMSGGSASAFIFRAGVATLTGRVRGGVGFTQARNTPFQGSAAH
jgi:hypothetical protein